MKSITRVIGVMVVFAALFGAGAVGAQTAGVDATPDVIIKNFTLKERQYFSGSTVTGSFTIENRKNMPAANIMYSASLVGGYNENGLATEYFDTVNLGTVSLAANESKKVNVSYTLPGAFAGKGYGIQIQAKLASGIPLGWGDFGIEIKGTNSAVTLTRASLLIDGEEKNPAYGHTVPEGKSATLLYTIQNKNTASVAVVPTVKIFERSVDGTLLATLTPGTATIAAGKATTTRISLPLFDGKPGVYVGTVSFLNAQGQTMGSEITLRYIVAGQIVTINSVTSDKQKVKSGDTIFLLTSYGGTPYNIDTREYPNNASSTVSIKVFNEKDHVIGTYRGEYNFDIGASTVFQVPATKAAQAVRVEMEVKSSAGKLLESYSSNISSDYVAEQKKIKSPLIGTKKVPYAAIVIVGLITGVLLVLYMSRRSNSHFGSLIVAIAIGAGSLGLFQITAHMFTVTQQISWDVGLEQLHMGPTTAFSFSSVSIAVKKSDGTFAVASSVAPGQQYYLVGNIFAPACSNSLQQLNFMTVSPSNAFPNTSLYCEPSYMKTEGGVTFPVHNVCMGRDATATGPNVTAKDGYWAVGVVTNWGTSTPRGYVPARSEVFTTPQAQFSLGPMTAPTTNGAYKVWLRVANYWANNAFEGGRGEYEGWAIGYENLTVASAGSARTEAVCSGCTLPSNTKVYFNGGMKSNPGYWTGVTTGQAYTFAVDDPGASYTRKYGVCNYSGTNDCTPSSYEYSAICSDGLRCEANGIMVNSGTNNGTKVVFQFANNVTPITGGVCTAIPNPAYVNNSVTWTVSGVTGGNGTYSYSWSGTDGLTGAGTGSGSTNQISKTYSSTGRKDATVVVTSNGSSQTFSCTSLTVNNFPSPTVDLKVNGADSASVTSGQTVSLTWTSTNASSCTGGGSDLETRGAVTNSVGTTSNPITSNMTFAISCTGPGGTGEDTATVTVTETPGTLTCRPENPAVPGVRIVQAQVGTPVKWFASGGTTYSWLGSDGLDGVGDTLITVYQNPGIKEASVTSGGVTVSCTIPAFTVSVEPGYREF